jgi:hypothetical protein
MPGDMGTPPPFASVDIFDAFVVGDEGFTSRRENSHRRPRGYAPWRPQGKTWRVLGQVEQVIDEYGAHLPLTVRQIFYRLVGAFGYPKDERAYGRLKEYLVRARRARMLRFDAIRDDGIVTVNHTAYGGVHDFHDETGRRARAYRLDRQKGQQVRLELWCEAAGMLHQLDRVASEYSVHPYSNSGFASLTATREIANRALEREVPTVLLHVGDFDPSGESIFEATAEDAAAFVEADKVIGTQRIEARRVALNRNQITYHNLPTAPVKKSDARSKNWHGGTSQLEALPPNVLAQVVENAIREELDLGRYEQVLEQERRDRAELLALPPGGGS